MKRQKYFKLILFCLLQVGFVASLMAQKQSTIVVDAGHGGKDPGASGNGVVEKKVALAVALKLGEYLKKMPNTKVVYTRKKDVFIELNERARIANHSGADLFISIHCNANPSTRPFGSETYTLGLHRTQDNLEVAKTENSVIFFEDDYEKQYEGFDPNNDEDYIILTLMQNVNLDQSIKLSTSIQKQFKERVGRKSRGVKQAGFLVLRKTTMPGVLIELGFLSNSKEAKFLNSAKGQDYMASAIYRAIRDYLQAIENENPVEEVAEVEEVQVKEIIPTYYRVQFATYKKEKKKKFRKFKNLKDVLYYKVDNLYKYTTGNDTSYQKMLKWKDEVQNLGFKDAFIIAMKEGKRISLKEAFQK